MLAIPEKIHTDLAAELQGYMPEVADPTWPVMVPSGLLRRILAAIDAPGDVVSNDGESREKRDPELSLPDGAEWVISEDERELTLMQNGRRLGGIHVWSDDKTGEEVGWSAVLAGDGNDVELPAFMVSEDEARAAVLAALT